MNKIIRYSEAFKLQVVREVESGRHGSCHGAAMAYGIRGSATVAQWVRRYGKSHLLKKVVRVETTDERNELKRFRERVRELERALSDAYIELRLDSAYLKLACKAAGEDDVAEFKKKHVGMLSMPQRQTVTPL